MEELLLVPRRKISYFIVLSSKINIYRIVSYYLVNLTRSRVSRHFFIGDDKTERAVFWAYIE
jgi:hypothetical protein